MTQRVFDIGYGGSDCAAGFNAQQLKAVIQAAALKGAGRHEPEDVGFGCAELHDGLLD